MGQPIIAMPLYAEPGGTSQTFTHGAGYSSTMNRSEVFYCDSGYVAGGAVIGGLAGLVVLGPFGALAALVGLLGGGLIGGAVGATIEYDCYSNLQSNHRGKISSLEGVSSELAALYARIEEYASEALSEGIESAQEIADYIRSKLSAKDLKLVSKLEHLVDESDEEGNERADDADYCNTSAEYLAGDGDKTSEAYATDDDEAPTDDNPGDEGDKGAEDNADTGDGE